MFPGFEIKDEDPWPQCVDPNVSPYEVPETIDTTPLPPSNYEPHPWPIDLSGIPDEAPPIGPLPAPEPGSVEWFRDGLDPTPEPNPLTKLLPDLSFLTDMF